MNYQLVAVQFGDLMKYSTTLNEIDRLAGALFRFRRESFPNEAITSQRAQLIYDWILSLAKQEINPDERHQLLFRFCRSLAPNAFQKNVDEILRSADIPLDVDTEEDYTLFFARTFHPEVVKHSESLFLQENYFHAVFEASKAYNMIVKQKAQSSRDGAALMLEVWGCDKGVLRVTACLSETDTNVQDGIKFLSAGLMQAIRNPTAHEPALHWPINKQDCLDILSFISFLFRQLDKATYTKA